MDPQPVFLNISEFVQTGINFCNSSNLCICSGLKYRCWEYFELCRSSTFCTILGFSQRQQPQQHTTYTWLKHFCRAPQMDISFESLTCIFYDCYTLYMITQLATEYKVLKVGVQFMEFLYVRPTVIQTLIPQTIPLGQVRPAGETTSHKITLN